MIDDEKRKVKVKTNFAEIDAYLSEKFQAMQASESEKTSEKVRRVVHIFVPRDDPGQQPLWVQAGCENHATRVPVELLKDMPVGGLDDHVVLCMPGLYIF